MFGRELRGLARASRAALALWSVGCGGTYEAVHADVERARGQEASARVEDERAIAGPVLERGPFVRAVLHRNPSIESARSAWRAAVARVRQADAFDDPMVDVGAAPLSVASSARFGWQVGVSQRLPWFGKRALDGAVASAEAEAARSDLEATRRDLALTASLLYDQYFVASRALAINVDHTALMRALRDAATAQLASGRGSLQDPLQAESELAHMEHDALRLASQRDVTIAQMNELLHRDPDLALPPPPNDLALPTAPDADAKRLEAEAIAQRPDIVAARQHARAEEARAARADRDAYPDVTVSTSYNAMWDTPEHRWMIGLGFSVPIQSARRGGAADEANAARARFEAEIARMSDAARTQVVVALRQLEESRHLLHLYEERLVPLARARIDAARTAFASGQGTFASVVEAEHALRDVELQYQVARADYAGRRAQLDRALGRIPGEPR
jgi:outer membrane protein TolC